MTGAASRCSVDYGSDIEPIEKGTAIKTKIISIITALALALGITAVSTPAVQASSSNTWTLCSQSAHLGQRVCFDKSLNRVYWYRTAPWNVPSGSTPTTWPNGTCSSFTATPTEWTADPNHPYRTSASNTSSYCGGISFRSSSGETLQRAPEVADQGWASVIRAYADLNYWLVVNA